MDTKVSGNLQRLSHEKETILTENVSEQGLQFYCKTPMKEGEFFRFTLVLPDDGETLEGVARSVRVRETGEGFLVGGQIVEMSYAQSRALQNYLESQLAAQAASAV